MGRIGETLKKARQLREIDLREISDATKISIRYLEAIETNQFDALPGGVFTKGFIRAYANYIGLDGQAMVDNYVHEAASAAEDGTGAEQRPSGLHRPEALPSRRAGPAGAGPAPPPERPSGMGSQQAGQPLRILGLQSVGHERADGAPRDSEPGALPRIVWLVAATGLLFCILAAWRYMADDPIPKVETAPALVAQSSSAQPSPGEPPPGEPMLAGTAPSDADTPAELAETPPGREAAADAPPQVAAASTDPPAPAPPPARARPEPLSPPAGDPPFTDASITEPAAAEQESHSAAAPEDGAAMLVTITARTATRLRIVCDGREALDRDLQRGEVESLRCERLIRLSAPDASSLLLAINGSSCRPLGQPASPLYGYVIRADNYRELCPEIQEAIDVNR